MALLANFPIVSQLTPITSDGRLSENAQFDCVAASIGACILWYEGKTQWDVDINPDRLKDAAYGEALHNSGTDAARYVDFCKSLGYTLYSVTEPDRLSAVKTAHTYIDRNIPVIFTEDDPYADASLGWTHVCVWYGDDANGLTALDPYIAKPIYRSDASWANLLRSHQIWIVEKEVYMVDEAGAIPMLVAEQRTFINQNDHTWLVIHKTASGGSAQNIATFFANDPAMASTHYVVGQDGTIVQCVLEKDGAGGNCCLETGHASYLPTGINLNVKTVSIEHVDPASDNSTPLTQAQKVASFRLVRDICLRHNIPMRGGDASGGIIGHHDIAPLSRARCPGNYPWSELFAYLGGEQQIVIAYNTPGVKPFFTEVNPGQWRCLQTGKILQGAILSFYKAFGGNYLCGLTHLGLPVSNEISLGGTHGAVKQHFEDGVLFFDPAHEFDQRPGEPASESVYLAKLYSGSGQDPLVAELQAENAALQSELAKATQPTGIDPAHVASFQQARAADAQKLRDGAQALATALLVPVQ